MRPTVVSLLLVLSLALPPGTAALAAQPKTSKSFSFATYKEREDRTIVLVSTLAAAVFERASFVPLQVAVGVRGRGPTLTVGAESFELIDRDGRHYPMASYNELLAEGNFLERVELVERQNPIVTGQQFANSTPVDANFFPATGTRTRVPTVHMPRETYFVTLIYFPYPAGGSRTC